jgi:hypothetical protein
MDYVVDNQNSILYDGSGTTCLNDVVPITNELGKKCAGNFGG